MINDEKGLIININDNAKLCPNLEDNPIPVKNENVRCYVSNDVYDYIDEEYAPILCDAWKHETGALIGEGQEAHYEFEFVDDDLVNATNSFLRVNNKTVRDECVTFTNLTGDTVDIYIEKMSGKGRITDDKLVAMRRKPPVPEPPILDPSAPDSSQSTNTNEQVFTLESNESIYIYTNEPSTFSYYLDPSPILRERVYPPTPYDVVKQTNERGNSVFNPNFGYPYYVEFKNLTQKIEFGKMYDMNSYLRSANHSDGESTGSLQWLVVEDNGECTIDWHPHDIGAGKIMATLVKNEEQIPGGYSYLGNYIKITNNNSSPISLSIRPMNETYFWMSKKVPEGEYATEFYDYLVWRRFLDGHLDVRIYQKGIGQIAEMPNIRLDENESLYLYTRKGESDQNPTESIDIDYSYVKLPSLDKLDDGIIIRKVDSEAGEAYFENSFTDAEEYLLSFDVSITEPYFGIDSISEIILVNSNQDYISIRDDTSVGWIIYNIVNESVMDLMAPLENANVLPPSNISIYKKDGEVSIIFKGKNGEYECPLLPFEFDNTIRFRTEYEFMISNMKLLEYTIEQ